MTKWYAGHVASHRFKSLDSANNNAMHKHLRQAEDQNDHSQAARVGGQHQHCHKSTLRNTAVRQQRDHTVVQLLLHF